MEPLQFKQDLLVNRSWVGKCFKPIALDKLTEKKEFSFGRADQCDFVIKSVRTMSGIGMMESFISSKHFVLKFDPQNEATVVIGKLTEKSPIFWSIGAGQDRELNGRRVFPLDQKWRIVFSDIAPDQRDMELINDGEGSIRLVRKSTELKYAFDREIFTYGDSKQSRADSANPGRRMSRGLFQRIFRPNE